MQRKKLLVVIPLAPCKERILAKQRTLRNKFFHSYRPTFVFLKGQTKVDQVRGANKSYVFVHSEFLPFPQPRDQSISALENAVQKHSSGSTPAAFSGRGQSLGSSAGPPPPRNDGPEAPLVNLDPQVKKLLIFFGAYLLFWYLSR
jgi:hypothetical protein